MGEQIILPAFIFLMVMVGGGIVIGTYFFIGSGYDFRAGHAALLGAKIEGCVNNGFNLNRLASPESENGLKLLAEKCRLNKKVLESYYKIKICKFSDSVYNQKSCVAEQNPVFSYGDVQPCGFRESESAEKFLGCAEKKLEFTNYIIVTATNQQIRRNVK